MDPDSARTRVQRRRSTMLKLLLENRKEEVDASTFEPAWGEGEEYRTLLNPPEGADGTLALFYQMDEADVLGEEAPPTPVLARERVPDPPSGRNAGMREILVRLVKAQQRKDHVGISQKDATVAIAAVPPRRGESVRAVRVSAPRASDAPRDELGTRASGPPDLVGADPHLCDLPRRTREGAPGRSEPQDAVAWGQYRSYRKG